MIKNQGINLFRIIFKKILANEIERKIAEKGGRSGK